MNPNAQLSFIFALIVSTLAPVARAQNPATATPNIVIILADDLGYGDVSACNPQSKIRTPQIDSLAQAGTLFTDAHSPSAVCTPTRYGLLTGRYAWRTRLQKGVLHGYDTPLIEPNRLTLPAMLKDKGYATACIGKWHLGLGWQLKSGQTGAPKEANVDFTKPLTAGPHTVGFDHSYIIPASLDMDPYVYIENGKVVEQPTSRVENSPRPAYYRGGLAAPSFKHQNVIAEITKNAEDWIDARAKDTAKPFFLYFALTSPHTPHVPRDQFKGKSGAGNYGDFVMETDWAVGRILDALRRNNLDDNTLVIFTSDNGAHAQPLNLVTQFGHYANGPFRGQKSDAWEGGHHVPFIARWPNHVPARQTISDTLCLTDLVATVADITGVKLPNVAAEDSASFRRILTGGIAPAHHLAFVFHSIDGDFAVLEDKWKLILCPGSGGWSLPAKSVPPGAPPVQLYNMHDDPSESNNIARQRPDLVEHLKRVLDHYRSTGRSVEERG
jgi:arylsulfatase A-like enzyme